MTFTTKFTTTTKKQRENIDWMLGAWEGRTEDSGFMRDNPDCNPDGYAWDGATLLTDDWWASEVEYDLDRLTEMAYDNVGYEGFTIHQAHGQKRVNANILASKTALGKPAYPPIRESETFVFVSLEWDVTKAWREIITTETEVQDVPFPLIKQLFDIYKLESNQRWDDWKENGSTGAVSVPIMSVNVDVKKALSDETDLSIPIIIGYFPERHGGTMIPIDGWHRIFKAYRLGRTLKAYVLTKEENQRILYDPLA